MEQQLKRSQLKRRAILEAARAAFCETGVDATSMDQLAARAGVSKRTVYNHFASKDQLVTQLMGQMWEKSQQRMYVKYNPAKPLDIQLLTLLGAEIEVICQQEFLDLVRIAIGHFFYSPRALEAEIDRMAGQETSLLRWLTAANDDGKLDIDDTQFAAAQLQGLVKGSCFWPQVLGIAPVPYRAEQRRLAEEAVRMFLARYAPNK